MKIVVLWCISLLLMNIMYLVFSFFEPSKVETEPDSCIAVGVLLHLFLLISFCFSLCINYCQYFVYYSLSKMYPYIFVRACIFSIGDSFNTKKLFINLNQLKPFILAIPVTLMIIPLVIDKTAYIINNNDTYINKDSNTYIIQNK